MQTLKQAVQLIRSGQSQSMSRAAGYLLGLPSGSWPETSQARQRVLGDLPLRAERAYTTSEFVEAVYCIDDQGRYQSAL